MFRCQVTGKVSAPREPQIKVVVETRKVTYANTIYNPLTFRKETITSHGFETVRELCVTQEGLNLLQRQKLEVGFHVK